MKKEKRNSQSNVIFRYTIREKDICLKMSVFMTIT